MDAQSVPACGASTAGLEPKTSEQRGGRREEQVLGWSPTVGTCSEPSSCSVPCTLRKMLEPSPSSPSMPYVLYALRTKA